MLQPRDRMILHSASRFGVLSSTQVMALHFKSISHTTTMKRLRILEKGRFLIRVTGLPRSESAWSLSKKGAEAIEAEEPNSYSNQNTIVHEVELSALRIVLEAMGLGDQFVSEMTLRRGEAATESRRLSNRSTIPDGIFVADTKDSAVVVAVELELHPKNHSRYRKVFYDYARKDSLHHVWYVVSDAGIGNTVIGQWRRMARFENSPTLIVSLLSDLKQNEKEAAVYLADGSKKKVSDVFEIKAPLLSETRNAGPQGTQTLSTN